MISWFLLGSTGPISPDMNSAVISCLDSWIQPVSVPLTSRSEFLRQNSQKVSNQMNEAQFSV